jgi:hypothetical protein
VTRPEGGLREGPGRVAATGGGGVDAAAGAALERRGGGGGVAATGFDPNRFKPLADRFAAAAATIPKPGFGRSSVELTEEASGFCRRVDNRS